jgi:tripartite-type tricarboxylate transporter receptor subunit TctC
MESRWSARMPGVRRALSALAFVLMLMPAAQAQDWPSRAIQFIVPFPAGGAVDVLARVIAEHMSRTLQQPIVVVNRDGASGTIGATAIVTAQPDGYVLGFMTIGPFTVQPHVMNLTYKADAAQGICQTASLAFAVAVPPQSKIMSLEQLIAEGRKEDNKIAFGYGGTGTPPHIALAQLQQMAKTKMLAVPFRGDPSLITAMRAGDIDVAVLNVGLAAAQNFRLLAFLRKERAPDYPDIPTATELGYPLVHEVVAGIVGPRGLPAAAVAKLAAACQAAVQSPRFLEIVKSGQQEVRYAGPEAFEKAIMDTNAAMAPIIRDAGIRAE